MRQPLISAIIPVYNVEKYLDRCLTSVVENDYRNLQIVCVNDGSVDSSGEILDQWVRKDDRIQVVTTENGGLAKARNAGIRVATGDYIGFVDSDDWIHPQYFSILLDGVRRMDGDVAICGFQRVYEDAPMKTYELSDITWNALDRSRYLELRLLRRLAWAKLYKKELISPTFNPSLLRSEDLPYNLSILHRFPNLKFAYANEPLYYYFTRQDSLVNTRTWVEGKLLFDYFVPIAEKCVKEHDSIGQELYVLESAKTALVYRYDVMFDKEQKESAREVCKRARRLLLSANRSVPFNKRILHYLFLLFPALYRKFRIANDPSLLKWEKGQREALRREVAQK